MVTIWLKLFKKKKDKRDKLIKKDEGLALAINSRTRNPNPKYPNPYSNYPNPRYPISISGRTSRNPNLFRVIQVYTPSTRISPLLSTIISPCSPVAHKRTNPSHPPTLPSAHPASTSKFLDSNPVLGRRRFCPAAHACAATARCSSRGHPQPLAPHAHLAGVVAAAAPRAARQSSSSPASTGSALAAAMLVTQANAVGARRCHRSRAYIHLLRPRCSPTSPAVVEHPARLRPSTQPLTSRSTRP